MEEVSLPVFCSKPFTSEANFTIKTYDQELDEDNNMR